MEKIFCAYDQLNVPIDKDTGKEQHTCKKYGSHLCIKCDSRYDGNKILEYMATHERKE